MQGMPTRVAVLGTGDMGTALAQLAVRSGFEVISGSRRGGDAGAAVSLDAALASTTFVFNTIPAHELAATAVVAPAGVLVVDVSNPEDDEGRGLRSDLASSGAEALARLWPRATIAKALNHVYAEVLEQLPDAARTPSTFVASDSADAKAIVERVLAAMGLRAIDAGPLASSRLTEPFAMLMVELVHGRGWKPEDTALLCLAGSRGAAT